MYGIVTYMWLRFIVNVVKYFIHQAFGVCNGILMSHKGLFFHVAHVILFGVEVVYLLQGGPCRWL